jgi:hypothetical protein
MGVTVVFFNFRSKNFDEEIFLVLLVSFILSDRHTKKYYFLCRLFKTTGKKNESSFFVLFGIIDQHHKNIGVILNHFCTNDKSLAM